VFNATNLVHAFRKACAASGPGKWLDPKDRDAGYDGSTLHGLRRSGVRNLHRAAAAEDVGMKISGHRTRAVCARSNIADDPKKLIELINKVTHAKVTHALDEDRLRKHPHADSYEMRSRLLRPDEQPCGARMAANGSGAGVERRRRKQTTGTSRSALRWASGSTLRLPAETQLFQSAKSTNFPAYGMARQSAKSLPTGFLRCLPDGLQLF
jgi:hypothetical protein